MTWSRSKTFAKAADVDSVDVSAMGLVCQWYPLIMYRSFFVPPARWWGKSLPLRPWGKACETVGATIGI